MGFFREGSEGSDETCLNGGNKDCDCGLGKEGVESTNDFPSLKYKYPQLIKARPIKPYNHTLLLFGWSGGLVDNNLSFMVDVKTVLMISTEHEQSLSALNTR